MRASSIFVTAMLLGLGPAAAADLYRDGPHRRAPRGVSAEGDAYGYGYGYGTRVLSNPYVVGPPATVMIVPPNAAPAPLRYAPPPLYPVSPPLITALPIVGGFLVPVTVPPPATALDAYDRRFDYNQ